MNTTSYFPPARLNPGRAWFVAPLDDDRSGLSWNTARNSLQSAVNLAMDGDTIYVAPGSYDETVTMTRGKALMIIGVGPRGSIEIAPTDDGASALVCHSDNCLFQNLSFVCPDTTSTVGLTATGSGLRVIGCKFSGAAQGVLFGPGTVDETDDDEQGIGVDAEFLDCEFTDGTSGFILQGTDYGPASRVVIENSRFYRLSASSIDEATGDGGDVDTHFRNLLVRDCSFEPALVGTEPTNYVLLNDSNINSGLITGCHFTVAINSTKNLVSTLVKWVGNWHPEGASSGQPS